MEEGKNVEVGRKLGNWEDDKRTKSKDYRSCKRALRVANIETIDIITCGEVAGSEGIIYDIRSVLVSTICCGCFVFCWRAISTYAVSRDK